MDRVINVRLHFACVAVFDSKEIPHTVRKAFRLTDPLVVDTLSFLEAHLLSYGFMNTQGLARKLESVVHFLNEMVR